MVIDYTDLPNQPDNQTRPDQLIKKEIPISRLKKSKGWFTEYVDMYLKVIFLIKTNQSIKDTAKGLPRYRVYHFSTLIS